MPGLRGAGQDQRRLAVIRLKTPAAERLSGQALDLEAIALGQSAEVRRDCRPSGRKDAFILGCEGSASPFVCEILAGNQRRTAEFPGIDML